MSQASWWGHTDTLNLKGQRGAFRGGTTSHTEKHTLTHPLAQPWASHPNLATNVLKVTPNTEHLKVLFKTGLTLFGGCTFSVCWRQLLSVCQAGQNGIIHNLLKMRQGLEKSSSYLISPEKICQTGARKHVASVAATAQQKRPPTCMGAKRGSSTIPREQGKL